MSFATGPPAVDPQRDQRCPRCGAVFASDQDWCLECGTGATTRIVRPPNWRIPVAIVVGVLGLVVAGVAVAFVLISEDAQNVVAVTTPAKAPAQPGVTATQPAPAPGVSTTPQASPAPKATTPTTAPKPSTAPTPAKPPSPSSAASGPIPDLPSGVKAWPARKEGFTVALLESKKQKKAYDRAKELSGNGVDDVGILRSDDWDYLTKGVWVVFSGVFDGAGEAKAHKAGLDGGVVRRVRPR